MIITGWGRGGGAQPAAGGTFIMYQRRATSFAAAATAIQKPLW